MKSSSSKSLATGPQTCDPGLANQTHQRAMLGSSQDSVALSRGCGNHVRWQGSCSSVGVGHLPLLLTALPGCLHSYVSWGLPSCSFPHREPDLVSVAYSQEPDPWKVKCALIPRSLLVSDIFLLSYWCGLISWTLWIVQWLLFPHRTGSGRL